jgi:hypothetical protein
MVNEIMPDGTVVHLTNDKALSFKAAAKVSLVCSLPLLSFQSRAPASKVYSTDVIAEYNQGRCPRG